MEKYISILRGINLGSHNKLPMPDLKKIYEGLKFMNPVTYVQSGNVVFETGKTERQELPELIRKTIYKKFGYDVPVIVLTTGELKSVINKNPFIGRKGIDEEKLHVTFLDKKPSSEFLGKIKNIDFSPDLFMAGKNEIYLYCPNGYGRTKLTNTFFENKLKVTATTRNWKTVNELLKIAI